MCLCQQVWLDTKRDLLRNGEGEYGGTAVLDAVQAGLGLCSQQSLVVLGLPAASGKLQ